MYLQVICVVKENKIGLHEFFAVLIYPKKKMMWLLSPLDMYIYIICKLVREQINVGQVEGFQIHINAISSMEDDLENCARMTYKPGIWNHQN